jgi:N utilization substance protein B
METEGANRADADHLREVLNGAIDGAPGLRAEISPFLDRGIDELSPVEHSILLIGAYELKHRAEIPFRVVINEAVELAKSFGGTDGFKYVNGVLDKLAVQMRPDEPSGRQAARPR